MQPAFDLTVLGGSGGPVDATCGLMLKPSDTPYGADTPVVLFDGGSCLRLLAECVMHQQGCRSPEAYLAQLPQVNLHHQLYGSAEPVSQYVSAATLLPFAGLAASRTPLAVASSLLQNVGAVCITHPHLDHIAGFAINTPLLCSPDRRVPVVGLPHTTDALRTHVFNNTLWPDLVNSAVVLQTVQPGIPVELAGRYSVTPMPVLHGTNVLGRYLSAAFLVLDKVSGQHLLVFGDFESDARSGTSMNRLVWELVAGLVARGLLRAIVVECSEPLLTPTEALYGHMSPAALAEELASLERMVRVHNPSASLEGLQVIVTHIKEAPTGTNPRTVIWNELRLECAARRLAVRLLLAYPGVTYTL